MGQIQYVRTHTTTATYATATTVTFNYAASVPAGNVIVLGISASSGFTFTSATDNASNTYTYIAYNQTTGPDTEIWYCQLTNPVTTSNKVTITLGGGTNQTAAVVALEFTGMFDFSTIVGNAISPGTTSLPAGATTHTVALATPNNRNAVVFSILKTAGASGQTFTVSSGWTGVVPTGPSTTLQTAFQYKIETTPTTESNTITWGTSAGYAYAMGSLLSDPRDFLSLMGVGS